MLHYTKAVLAAPLLTAGLLIASLGTASATVTSGTVTGGTAFTAGGTFIKLTVPLSNPLGPPNSVGQDTFNLPNLYAFDESQNILLASPLSIDVGSSPIPAGTQLASHYIFFDPNTSQNIIGTVNFDSQVLGIITSTPLLAASDFLANTGVNYLNPAARGLEPGDSVTISGTNQILFNTTAASPGDYVRVLTAFSPSAVPEPGSVALLVGMSISGAGMMLRRRRK